MEPAVNPKSVPPPFGYHVPTMMSQLGPRVKGLREHHRLYRSTLAKILKVSSHMIRRIETKKTMPRADLLLEIANTFQVSVNYLLSDAEESYPIQDPMANFTNSHKRWQ